MIGALLLALAQVGAPSAPPVPAAPAVVDPARLAAAQRLLDATHIEQQYDLIFTRMIPLMTVQIFGSLKDNVTMPARLRTYLADGANEAAAERIFATEAVKAFKTKYPQMRRATAAEYARVFTADELTALATFYLSPLGQKALNSLPDLQSKLMPIGMTAGAEAGRAAMEKTVEQLGLVEQRPRS